jgi:cytochrome c
MNLSRSLAALALLALVPTCQLYAQTDPAAAEALAKKSNCVACHSVDKKIVGPGFKEVAAKYKGDATAEEKLIAKVKQGGQGVWGPVPMPPNPQLKDEDVKTLVHWILSI